MSGYPGYELKPKLEVHFIDKPPYLVSNCFGKRMEAYKKCESCEDIMACSFDTLCRVLTKEGYSLVSDQYGELVHVDKLEKEEETQPK